MKSVIIFSGDKMEKFKQAIYRFMSGRYGNDNLNNFIFFVSIILYLLNLFFIREMWISIISELLLIFVLFRSFSKNWQKRQKENYVYMNSTSGIRKYFSCLKKQLKDKENRYFICPSCSQIVRVPKGKVKIEITCPKCHKKFDRKA